MAQGAVFCHELKPDRMLAPFPYVDLDGALINSHEDTGEARSNFLLVVSHTGRIQPSFDGWKACYLLHIDFHLGSQRTVAVCLQDKPSEVADAICHSEDACLLRKMSRARMAQQVAESMEKFTSALEGSQVPQYVAVQILNIPYILLGDPPVDWVGVDLTHIGRCTSCVMELPPLDASVILDAGFNRQLFADHHAVASLVNLQRKSATAHKENDGSPVLLRDRPWEDLFCGGYPSVVHDGRCLQMWYRPFSAAIAIAESCDGVRWVKPSLGVFNAEGTLIDEAGFITSRAHVEYGFWENEMLAQRSGGNITIMNRRWHPWYRGRRNNIIARGAGVWGAHGSAVTLEPETKPFSSRYKMVFDCPATFFRNGTLAQDSGKLPCIAVSADGHHFESIHGEGSEWEFQPVLPLEWRGVISGDTYNQLVWDGRRGRYLMYTRPVQLCMPMCMHASV